MDRHFASLVREYLRLFPSVTVVGARQCGKTTLLEMVCEGWELYDLERTAHEQILRNDPEVFFQLHPERVAIDEAQRMPELFPALRVAIDRDRRQLGRFVLTGSSSPDLVRGVSETLAGRTALVELPVFTCAEAHGQSIPPIYHWFRSGCDIETVRAIEPWATAGQLHECWFRGGYPEPWVRGDDRFRSLWMEQYSRTYLDRDVRSLFPGLNREKFRLFLQMMAGLSGKIINYSEVGRALGVSSPTVRDYFEITHGTFLWRKVPACVRNPMKRVVKHPRGYVRDSGLLHHLLRIPSLDDLLAHPVAGASWEGFVVEQILRGLDSLGLSYDFSHYRTAGGAEVDLVLEGSFGLVPIEIKYAQAVSRRELRPLVDFVEEHGCKIGLVVANAERADLLEPNIALIPAGAL